MLDIMTLKDRVKQYCDRKNMAVTKFERTAGLSNGYFKDNLKRMSDDKVESIHRAFPDLNIDWLITGTGEMLKGEAIFINTPAIKDAPTRITEMVVVGSSDEIAVDIEALQNDLNITTSQLATIINDSEEYLLKCQGKLLPRHIAALEATYGETRISKYVTLPKKGMQVEVRVEEIKKTIVLTPDIIRDPGIDIKAEYKKGNLDEYAKPTQDIVPANHIKVYTYCDDMEPEIRSGEPVLVQLLPAGISIVPGQMYFIDLPSGGIIRYIEKEVDGVIYLKARNSNYGDIAVHRDEVQSLSLVRLIMRSPRAMSMKESTATELLVNKDRHLDRLLDQMAEGGERERMLIDYITKNK